MPDTTPQPEQHRYFAYADGMGRSHGHVIDAPSFEAAAVGFTGLYSPPGDSDGDIRIFVTDLDKGREHCFVVDLQEGEAAPCD